MGAIVNLKGLTRYQDSVFAQDLELYYLQSPRYHVCK